MSDIYKDAPCVDAWLAESTKQVNVMIESMKRFEGFRFKPHRDCKQLAHLWMKLFAVEVAEREVLSSLCREMKREDTIISPRAQDTANPRYNYHL